MDACILIDKPQNMTSFDVCYKLRKLTNEKRIGHTGTLDPNATGLIIVLLGKYTKFLPYCNHDKKEYIATCKLGIKTDTQDIWGKIVEEKAITSLDEITWKEILNKFIGDQQQIPPMVSAIKQNGKRLYQLAFEGKEVKREPRNIKIYELELLEYTNDSFKIRAVVSAGTYIRTLVEDIAKASNNLGTMSYLRRTKIQNICIEDACNIDDAINHLFDISINKIIDDDYQKIEIDDKLFAEVKNGKRINIDAKTDIVILIHKDIIVAAYEKEKEGLYKCRRGLL